MFLAEKTCYSHNRANVTSCFPSVLFIVPDPAFLCRLVGSLDEPLPLSRARVVRLSEKSQKSQKSHANFRMAILAMMAISPSSPVHFFSVHLPNAHSIIYIVYNTARLKG